MTSYSGLAAATCSMVESGNDTLDGGSGDDVYTFSGAFGLNTVVESSDAGFDTISFATVTDSLGLSRTASMVTQASASNHVDFRGMTLESIVGGLGIDTIQGASIETTWNVTGDGVGSIVDASNELLFASFESLNAGADRDEFLFADDGRLSGIIDGGGGFNTLDYSQRRSGVTVDLTANTTTAVSGSAQNFQRVIGTPENDVITGGKPVCDRNRWWARERYADRYSVCRCDSRGTWP